MSKIEITNFRENEVKLKLMFFDNFLIMKDACKKPRKYFTFWLINWYYFEQKIPTAWQ